MNNLYTRFYGVQMRKVPAEYQQKIIDWLLPNKQDKILEIGANKGDVQLFLRKLSPNTIGIDINDEVIKESNIPNMFIADAVKLPFENSSFTKTLSIHTIEHIPDLSKVFQELDRVTRPGGLSLHAFPLALIRGVDGAYLDAWKTTKNPLKALILARKLHVHKLSPTALNKFLQKTKWRVIKAKRIFVVQERGFSWVVLLQK